MPHPIRSFAVAGALLALSTGAAACGSSGGSDAQPTTTRAGRTTTSTEATTTSTEAASSTTTSGAGTTTTDGSAPSTTTAAGGPVDCQALLQEYTDVFDPDDLAEVVEFFRRYEPSMPDDVAEATERLAAAYDDAGDLGHLDLSSVDLTADAQTFSDWTNDGCPAG
ncbi:MAG: hypothetical protein JWO77_3781 [Ilumatobacteraceae bacterium]|nr:hypothetical protein [Ilumatobacteraceae bacterium]